MSSDSLSISSEQANATLAAILRRRIPGSSWSKVRRLIETRRVKIDSELCLDPARRLREGMLVEILDRPAPKPRQHEAVQIVYLDQHLVVVEKPSGISTVRHPAERHWPARRKALSPTLEDIVPKLIGQRERKTPKGVLPRLRIVQRLDKETSGLVVFARSVLAERSLGKQFRAHTIVRRYLAVVPGTLPAQKIATRLVRDRGDGRRGSTTLPGVGKEAITYIEVLEHFPTPNFSPPSCSSKTSGYSLLACRLETGRTHQIRIHLAELGHPICGEKVYNRRPGGPAEEDPSGAPRLALHAAELGLVHPVSGETMRWTMPPPADLEEFLNRLRDNRRPAV
jgi:23S rRNA pseudouridine1911/1915/1917 synthase